MPSVNIFAGKERISSIERILPDLRAFIARALSCGDRSLKSDEISIRVIAPNLSLHIAETEIEIKAHHYAPRVKEQDHICISIKDYLQKICPEAGSVFVWLQLSELGHSMEE